MCAGLIGGLGVTPSGNIGADGVAIFESVSTWRLYNNEYTVNKPVTLICVIQSNNIFDKPWNHLLYQCELWLSLTMFTEDNGVGSSGHAYHNKKLSVLSIALVFISILVFQLSVLVNALMPCWGG